MEVTVYKGRQVYNATLWWLKHGDQAINKGVLQCIHGVTMMQACDKCVGKAGPNAE